MFTFKDLLELYPKVFDIQTKAKRTILSKRKSDLEKERFSLMLYYLKRNDKNFTREDIEKIQGAFDEKLATLTDEEADERLKEIDAQINEIIAEGALQDNEIFLKLSDAGLFTSTTDTTIILKSIDTITYDDIISFVTTNMESGKYNITIADEDQEQEKNNTKKIDPKHNEKDYMLSCFSFWRFYLLFISPLEKDCQKEIATYLSKHIQTVTNYQGELYPGAIMDQDTEKAIHQMEPMAEFFYGNSKLNNKYVSMQDSYHTKHDIKGQLSLVFDNDYGLKVGEDRKSNEPVLSIVNLSYTGELSEKVAKLTMADMRYYDTISTIWANGNDTFTLTELFQLAHGTTKDVTEKQRKEMLTSLSKFEGTRLYMDITNEVNTGLLIDIDQYEQTGSFIVSRAQDITATDNNYQRIEKVEINQALLQWTGCKITTTNGKLVDAIKINTIPIMYAYAKAKNQVLSCKPSQMYIAGASINARLDAFQYYILKQILEYTNPNGWRHNNTIDLETVYKETGYTKPENRVEMKRDRDKIEAIFQNYVDDGTIYDFKPIKQGSNHSITAYQFNTKDIKGNSKMKAKKK